MQAALDSGSVAPDPLSFVKFYSAATNVSAVEVDGFIESLVRMGTYCFFMALL